ncbi:MAG: serine/threonine protein kinase, partial [Thermoanaerobaculia bacterium]|nr:serine/threonine protein kinase [Thermoanaerobaculia bacterium]
MQTPLQVGPYRLEKILGRGGMGIVYRAYDQRLDRQVAIKRILTEFDDPLLRERLRREARTTARLAHPAIIQVFDLLHEGGCDWIVMELVDGTSLAHVLESGPVGVDETLRYAKQIAEGLVAAHRLGIVHRDLKTENVMVLPDGRVKILDFGIAKWLDFAHEAAVGGDLTKTGGLIGTSRAMAPEQARGAGVGPRSDLFSFGVLLYETLTGISPFRAVSPVETLSRVLIFEPQPVDEVAAGVPRPLAELVDRLL